MFSILTRGWDALFRRRVLNLAGHRIELPPSHNLPAIRAKCLHYETEIVRLAEFLLMAEKRLVMVDVGANVGDTVALLPSRGRGHFLCIEASPTYFRFLERNLGELPNVRCINALVTEPGDSSHRAALVEAAGSAHVAQLASSNAISTVRRTTVDQVLVENNDFPTPNFLKIDTDGYDFKVLRGSAKLLQESHPAIHFELSFRHWKTIGGAKWKQAADFLSINGYQQCLLYDNLGYLVDVDSFERPSVLPSMESYAFRRDQFYLNVVTWHGASQHFDAFKQSELQHPFDS